MKTPNPFELELIDELLKAHDAFLQGKLKPGTIRTQVLFRLASRRGRTLPAPEAGLTQTDHAFSGKFSRAISRLISLGLVERKAVGDRSEKLKPYQLGFARHAKRDRDIFLTPHGIELARSRAQAASPAPVPPHANAEPQPAPPGPGTPSASDGPQPTTVTYVSPPPKTPTPPHPTSTFSVRMGQLTVTYTVAPKKKR